jgi:import receptor subunit TOM70
MVENWGQSLLEMEFYDAHETAEDAVRASAGKGSTGTSGSGADISSDENNGNNAEAVESHNAVEKVGDVVGEKDINAALEAKESGNNFFRVKDYDRAIDEYSRAIECCPETDEHKEVLAVLLGNRAACYSAEEDWELVVEDCNRSIVLKADYVKVLLRRSQALEKLEKLEEALSGTR